MKNTCEKLHRKLFKKSLKKTRNRRWNSGISLMLLLAVTLTFSACGAEGKNSGAAGTDAAQTGDESVLPDSGKNGNDPAFEDEGAGAQSNGGLNDGNPDEDGSNGNGSDESGFDDSGGRNTEEETEEDTVSNTAEGELSLGDYLKEDKSLDLEALQKINPDIYGWIEITGTQMSFPLLQSSQDEYFYLTHDIYGESDDAGCIYTEYFNRKDFSDPNTILYGRNVNGRFAGLHQYQDRDFFDSHRDIKIYLKGKTLRWKIFAAYTYDDRHLIKIYDFWDKDIYAAYLKDVFSQRAMDTYLDTDMEVTAEDRIITLSTGVTGQDDRRYLVQAVLTK